MYNGYEFTPRTPDDCAAGRIREIALMISYNNGRDARNKALLEAATESGGDLVKMGNILWNIYQSLPVPVGALRFGWEWREAA